jgi:probable rRNA maturation factor
MKNLNFKFRKKNKTTDVLSFPLKNYINRNLYIGDIAISYEIINKRSKLSNFFLEFDKIWVHGYFHLNGYDHKRLKDFKKMNKKENLVLNYFHKIN